MAFNRITDIYFFTATILNWNHALSKDIRKDLIMDALKFLHDANRIELYGFVIMPNHIHLLWQDKIEEAGKLNMLTQGSLLKFTSRQILNQMNMEEKLIYKVNAADREYQIWEREPLWIECFNMKTLEQKLEYIHQNPCTDKWNLAKEPTMYKYSSAKFYETGVDDFGFMKSIYD